MPRREHSESESKTRRTRINPKLEALGWRVIPYNPSLNIVSLDKCALTEYPTANGPADFALIVGGKILGIIEAKKLTLGPQNVLTQAERYSRGIDGHFNFHGFHVPFLYSTNGEVIWFHDVRHEHSRSRRIADFHAPAALDEMINNLQTSQELAKNKKWHPRLRPYQVDACKAMEQAIIANKRQMLVAMATGTGKTFTLVNEVYRLMKAGAGKRILFLVDRRALAAQAVRAFATFDPEPGFKFNQIYEVYSQRFQKDDLDPNEKFDPKTLPSEYLKDPKARDAFAYVCTIQRMTINLFGRQAAYGLGDEDLDEDAEQIDIPIHAFDVVIADECHRGYSTAELSVWRNTLDHFDAVKIGLTATPAAHTKAYFKDIVFRYEYARAVREGFLVDYDAVRIKSKVRMHGVFLKEGEQVGLVDTQTGLEKMDEMEDEREFPSSEIEQQITAPDSNRKIIEELHKYCLQHEQKYGRLPKTLIFAVNDLPHTSHADQLVDICRDVFGRGDSFVQKITGRVDRPLQRIREFRNRPEPGIAVTVDMLSTGVDIPDLEFIVMLRPVKSRILFEQMLGRGTRKGELFPDKSHFTVFDCFDGTLLEYFRLSTAITAEPPDRPARSIVEVIDSIWANRDRQYNIHCLVKRLQRIDKEMSINAREEFSPFIPDGDMARFARELQSRLASDFAGTMKLLRKKEFQDMLLNYQRKPRVFIVAHATEDKVESEWLVRDGAGKEYKPEDYLAAFARFVKENASRIAAIAILLERPRQWSTDALSELRRTLASTPQRFTIDNLQRVHDHQYHKALVDIISMVKHAAHEQEPLLTAEERVERAMQALRQGRTFTKEQEKWLEYIRRHLVMNLSIDKDDFENLPVFSQRGGLAKARKVFGAQFEELLKQLNERVAA